MRHRLSLGLAVIGLSLLLAPGCATQSGPPSTAAGAPAELEYDELFDEPIDADVEDPFEQTNRKIFAGNRSFDRFVAFGDDAEVREIEDPTEAWAV